eukprot:2363368-Prymnesium_polylepis.1
MRLSSHQSASAGSSAPSASPFGGRCPPASSMEQSTHEKSPVSARDWLRPQHEDACTPLPHPSQNMSCSSAARHLAKPDACSRRDTRRSAATSPLPRLPAARVPAALTADSASAATRSASSASARCLSASSRRAAFLRHSGAVCVSPPPAATTPMPRFMGRSHPKQSMPSVWHRMTGARSARSVFAWRVIRAPLSAGVGGDLSSVSTSIGAGTAPAVPGWSSDEAGLANPDGEPPPRRSRTGVSPRSRAIIAETSPAASASLPSSAPSGEKPASAPSAASRSASLDTALSTGSPRLARAARPKMAHAADSHAGIEARIRCVGPEPPLARSFSIMASTMNRCAVRSSRHAHSPDCCSYVFSP